MMIQPKSRRQRSQISFNFIPIVVAIVVTECRKLLTQRDEMKKLRRRTKLSLF